MTTIKKLREAKGLSQSQLATAAGIGLRTYQGYEVESGDHVRDLKKAAAGVVLALADALGVDPHELLK